MQNSGEKRSKLSSSQLLAADYWLPLYLAWSPVLSVQPAIYNQQCEIRFLRDPCGLASSSLNRRRSDLRTWA